MATHQLIPFPADIQDHLTRFRRYLLARRGAGVNTVDLVAGFARRICTHFGRGVLTHDDIDDYIVGLRTSGASYAHTCNACRALELYSEYLGTPIKLGRPRKPERQLVGILSEAEVAVMINGARTLREKAILSLLAYSGVRNRELGGLRIRNVDLARRIVHVEVAKNQRERKVCIAGPCVETLAEYLQLRAGAPDELLFTTVRRSAPLAPQDLRKLVRVAARRAGIKKRVYPHLLRHSLATNLLHRGANVLTIQRQLGHAHLETTMIYLHGVDAEQEAQYAFYAPAYQ